MENQTQQHNININKQAAHLAECIIETICNVGENLSDEDIQLNSSKVKDSNKILKIALEEVNTWAKEYLENI